MQNMKQRVLQRFFLAAVGVTVDVQRQASNGLCQDPDTSVDSSRLQGCAFIDGLTAGGTAEEKAVCDAWKHVF